MDAIWRLDEELSVALRLDPPNRDYLFIIEWLFHGVPWIGGSFLWAAAAIGGKWPNDTQDKIILLNIGLFLDLLISGALKIFVQRPRPLHNREDFRYGAPIADQFSFPSGHTTRVAMLARLLETLVSMDPILNKLMWLFVGCVAVSRVSMGRHHPTDVIAGVLIGILEAYMTLAMPLGLRRGLIRIFI
ncbi:unnamed protein product, partial [Mesorhabditis belari]|uniref:Phosphatidic acid phosphatase type 2/haloperoxidase domain-containing protein n=1 Tax=Mesorhabditis belari TaxID=2138241 RepID=A0AAF3JAW0_9BILA